MKRDVYISSIVLSLPQRHQDTKNHKENLSVTLCFSVLVAILKCQS